MKELRLLGSAIVLTDHVSIGKSQRLEGEVVVYDHWISVRDHGGRVTIIPRERVVSVEVSR